MGANNIYKDIERYLDESETIDDTGFFYYVKCLGCIFSNPGLFAVVNHRFGNWILSKYGDHNKRYIRYLFNVIYYFAKKISIVWGKIYIQDGTPIGHGLYISNKGGVIIGAEKIGSNCTIGPKVTIGLDNNGRLANIGDNVLIEGNAVIYGDITLGNNCMVMSSTVLTRSIPDNKKVTGNPAKLVK